MLAEFQNILYGEKNKKHRVALSVGLLAVLFEYVRYFGHLSKWFVFFLMYKFGLVSCLVTGRITIGYNELLCERFPIPIASHIPSMYNFIYQIFTPSDHRYFRTKFRNGLSINQNSSFYFNFARIDL